MIFTPNPALDLVLERDVDVPVAFVWKAWTTPALLKRWFTPPPWVTTDCEIDLRAGGRFRTVMQGPDGPAMDNTGCFLEVVEGRRLVWTNALGPDFRPAPRPPLDQEFGFAFTAIVEMRANGSGTRYTATVLHADDKSRETHASMGFEQGWGTGLDQNVALSKQV